MGTEIYRTSLSVDNTCIMNRFFNLLIVIAICTVASCGRDYRKAIIGRWDAGKATLESRILVTIRGDGTLTAEITNSDIKPLAGTYQIDKDRINIKFPRLDMSYRIVTLDKKVLVMKWKYAKITWLRLE
ncbi:MAG: hypothetical protein A2176_00130 [Spirochaetes bacterium RBG_13_51_14]|nr:MAG: hypothetical protein A2176_00130 [Spirochaetes bacterium RBG_13_51_14]